MLHVINLSFAMFILGLGRYEKVDRTTMIIAGIVVIINFIYVMYSDMKELEN